jgi:Kef-type K+ transport system membrane component KefB
MTRVLFYSGLLLAGMIVSQVAELTRWHPLLHWTTMLCLSYIMVEVGLEFSAEQVDWRRYLKDAAVAGAAAMIPWVLVAVYFAGVLGTEWRAAGIVALFSAPTSAGLLFTMLAAAGLSRTWVFKKARALAIFDDLHTVLLIIPIKALFIGLHWKFGLIAGVSFGLLFAAYRWLNRLQWPTTKIWILLYGAAVTAGCAFFQLALDIRLEVLLPAFVLGCIINHRPSPQLGDDPHSWLDQTLKALFITLVGLSLPRVSLAAGSLTFIGLHVAAVTLLSNIGKCFPILAYRGDASLRDRAALSLAMFPRGEVGAGVLVVALSYGIGGISLIVGSLSLALNLLLTGVFIAGVRRLVRQESA